MNITESAAQVLWKSNMIVTRLIPEGKRYVRIYVEGVYFGMLECRDMNFFGIEENGELAQERWEEIERTYILPRGKKKALDLLLVRERTEKELYDRLVKEGYTEEQVCDVLNYVKQFPYLNDVRYALHYLRSKGQGKSIRQMEQTLREKGISSEDFSEAWKQYLEECAEERVDISDAVDIETEAVCRILKKKYADGMLLSFSERQRCYASLARRGFSAAAIRRGLQQYSDVDDVEIED